MKSINLLIVFLSVSLTQELWGESIFSVPVEVVSKITSEDCKHQGNDSLEPEVIVSETIQGPNGEDWILKGQRVLINIEYIPRKNMARKGKLTLNLESVEDVAGNPVDLNATIHVNGQSHSQFAGSYASAATEKIKNHLGIAGAAAAGSIGLGASTVLGGGGVYSILRAYRTRSQIPGRRLGLHEVYALYNKERNSIPMVKESILKKPILYLGLAALTTAAVKGQSAVIEESTTYNIVITH